MWAVGQGAQSFKTTSNVGNDLHVECAWRHTSSDIGTQGTCGVAWPSGDTWVDVRFAVGFRGVWS